MPQQSSLHLPPLIFQKSGKYTYVTTYKNFWDAELKKVRRCTGSTKTVGKIVGGGTEGEIVWTEDFLNDHEELKNCIAVRKKLAVREGKSSYIIDFSRREKMYPLSVLLKAKRREAGATFVLDTLLANTPLLNALTSVFAKEKTNKKILSFAYYLLLTQNKSLYLYENFAQKTRLPYQKMIYPYQIQRILRTITQEKREIFFRELNSEYEKQKEYMEHRQDNEKSEEKSAYLVFDSIAKVTDSETIKKNIYCQNNDEDSIKQKDVLLVVKRKTGQPVYYSEYPDTRQDISTVVSMLHDYDQRGRGKNCIFVTDSGWSSIQNIGKCLQQKINFVMNVNKNLHICKHIVEKNLEKLTDYCFYSTKIGCSSLCIPAEWQYPLPATESTNKIDKKKEKIFIHIYLDENIKHQCEEQIKKKVCTIYEKITMGIHLDEQEQEIKNTFLKKETTNKYYTNQLTRREYMRMKGVRVLISNVLSDSLECWNAYYERTRVEEAFSFEKQKIGGSRARKYANELTEGNIFIHFLSYAIGRLFREKIRTIKIDTTHLPYDLDTKILQQLNAIEQIQVNDTIYYTGIDGFNKKLIHALGISFPEEEITDAEEEEEIAMENDEDEYFNAADDIEQSIDN